MTEKKAFLVTGAAGFVGARFVESCHRRGIAVVSVDDESYFSKRKENSTLDFGKIIDRTKLFSEFEAGRVHVDAIVHLGACTDTTQLDEAYLRRMNLEYSQELWRIAADEGLPFVYASSAATYGDGAFGYDDNEAEIQKLVPLNPYGDSKQLFDVWAMAQEKQKKSPPAWAGFKFFNVYGFGERHKNKMASVVLHAFDQIKKNGRVKLFRSHKEGVSDGHQKRDFVFVQDVVDVLHFALEKPLKRGIYNLGSGKARTFSDLVTAVFRELGVPVAIDFIDTPIEIRSRYQYFTEAKMEKLVCAGYLKPFTSLEDGVKQYVSRLKEIC